VLERFTERARQIVVLAADAARELGHEQIGTEHLLLGLSAEQKGLAGWATGFTLDSLGRDFEDLYATVARIAGRRERPTAGQLPFTPQAIRAIELAGVEIDCRGLNFVGTEHLLLGLLDQLDAEPDGDIALRALSDLNVTPRQLRETVERFVPALRGGPSWMLRRMHGIQFRGARGAGWIDVLTLQAEAPLRVLLIRAAAAAMDAGQVVIKAADLLMAFSGLPDGAELLREAGVTPVVAQRTGMVDRDWIRINADKQVLAALIAAQRGAVERDARVVGIDDLLLALVTGQRSLLSRTGWEIGALRRPLEQRLEQKDAG
jgi:hypothetical protein